MYYLSKKHKNRAIFAFLFKSPETETELCEMLITGGGTVKL